MKLWRILAAASVLGTVLACSLPSDNDGKPVSGPNPSASGNTVVEPAKNSYATPTPADFALTVKTIRKQCFGTAGCNVTFRVQLSQTSTAKFDPDKTYELTYDVKGAEDPYTGTLEITDGKYSSDDEEIVSTKSSKAVLKAVITSVEEQ